MSAYDLIFRTTDALKWGDGKGSVLTAAEVDENFWILLSMVLALENNPAQPAEIDTINVTGNQMTITLTDATVFGPFTLPVATFAWKDNWVPDFEYKKFDFFTETRGVYLVLRDHNSDSPFDPARSDIGGAYYKLVFEYPVDFDIGFFFPGKPGTGIEDGKPIFAYRTLRPFYLKATLPDTDAGLDTGPADDLSFPIHQNTTLIGTMDFAASDGGTPTFSFADDVQFVPGDVFRILKPDAIDATAADLTVTFAGVKGYLEIPSSESASSS